MPAPLACLDLDGTLVDSRRPFAAAMRAALADVGLPDRPAEALHRHLGPPLEETAALLVAQDVAGGRVAAPDADRRAEELLQAYRARYRELGVPMTRPVAGIPAALDALRSAGWRLVIVTSKIAPAAAAVLDGTGLAQQVDALYAPGPEERHVPKERSLRRALTDHRADGTSPVAMVGDRHHDVDAAVACDVPAIGVTWAGDHRDELRDAGALRILDRPDELEDALAAIAT